MSARWLRLMATALVLPVACVLSLPVACSGTGSQRFEFQARVGGAIRNNSGALAFRNETGWSISLSKADVTIGPVYLNVIAPLQEASLLRWLPVRTAHAHGEGNLSTGRVVGEVLSQVTFNALSSELVSFPTMGTIVQEEVRTADLWFYPAPGIAADTTKIATVAVDVVGEADKADSHVAFKGSLILNDAWLSDANQGALGSQSIASIRQVRGIPTSFTPSEGGSLEIRFDITRLFRGADFSNLEANPIDAQGNRLLVQSKSGSVTTDQVMTNLYQGLHATSGTYSVHWVKPHAI